MSPTLVLATIAVALSLAAPRTAMAQLQTPPADTVLINGKIVTVDDRFSVVQALAVRDRKLIAVGASVDIDKLKGPLTRVIDLAGRTVIPGLIDNHAHWIRAAEHDELRFDGITKRADAVKLLTARLRATPAGQWIVVLGGWSEDQFTDEARGFTLAELDQLAPDHPVALQSIYVQSYLNTAALKAASITADTPNPANGTIEKDSSGKLTGVVRGAGGVAFIAAKVPLMDTDRWLANTRKLVRYLNTLGITAWLDAGGRGIDERHYAPYKVLADRGELDVRAFYTTIRQPSTPAQVDAVLAEIKDLKTFTGNEYHDHVGWGEIVFAPLTTQLLRQGGNIKPEDLAQMRRVVQTLASRGLYLNSHVEMEPVIDAFLQSYEELNKTHPIRGLRWSFSHLDQVTEAQLDRMKRLGMTAQIHSRPLIQGALMHKVHGERAWSMPPYRRIQDSGIAWGLGSDATAVTPSNPFYTLSFAITGEMIGGRKVNNQSITREEALIAHTRNNARFLFLDGSIGALQTGYLADLLVLDRDYLTVPAGEIKDIKPQLTMVGGKVVYEAGK